MIFFIKSNLLLDQNEKSYKILEKAHSALLAYRQAVRDVKAYKLNELSNIDISAKEIDKLLADKLKEEKQIFDNVIGDQSLIFDQFLRKVEEMMLHLKQFQSFHGRIEFANLLKIFNYEDEVYPDKLFRFQQLPALDKKFIPEVMSSAFATLFFEKSIQNTIRSPLEQYLTGLMSNINYQYYVTAGQIKTLFKTELGWEASLYVLGACPNIFSNSKDELKSIQESKEKNTSYEKILFERLTAAATITNRSLKYNGTIHRQSSSFFIRSTGFDETNDRLRKLYPDDLYLATGAQMLTWPKNVTRENIDKIMCHFRDRQHAKSTEKLDNPNKSINNLILVTSTFHIYKTALEVERWFFEQDTKNEDRPDNIVIVGDEGFYELMSHRDDDHNNPIKKEVGKNTAIHNMRKKKIKSFMFEIYRHALEGNLSK